MRISLKPTDAAFVVSADGGQAFFMPKDDEISERAAVLCACAMRMDNEQWRVEMLAWVNEQSIAANGGMQ